MVEEKISVDELLERASNSAVDRAIHINEHLTIVANFHSTTRTVHPALDFVDGKVYIGVFIDSTLLSKKDDKEIVSIRPLHYWITSDREIIPTHPEYLLIKDLRLSSDPIPIPNRWDIQESVDKWLKGKDADGKSKYPIRAFCSVLNSFLRYIELPEKSDYVYLTLWTIGTYFHPLFNAYPYIYLGGIKQSGKTKTLTLLSVLAFNAFLSANMSTSSIFRLVQNARGTLLIDENEKLSNKDRAQDFRSLLLSGYKKGAYVYRTEKSTKDRFISMPFEIYSPKAIANISGLEDVLEDRCKVIIMKRARNRIIANREINILDEEWQRIRNDLYLLVMNYHSELSELIARFSELSEYDEIVDLLHEKTGIDKKAIMSISAREMELWKPIFILAMFFDQKFSELSEQSEICELVKQYIENNNDLQELIPSFYFTSSQTTVSSLSSLLKLMVENAINTARLRKIENMTEVGEEILIKALDTLVQADGYYKVKEIRDQMLLFFDEEQKWLNTRWVGRALRRLGFTDKRRLGTGYEYFITKAAVEDLKIRLGIDSEDEKESSQESSLQVEVLEVSGDVEQHEKVILDIIKEYGKAATWYMVVTEAEKRGFKATDAEKILRELKERQMIREEEELGVKVLKVVGV